MQYILIAVFLISFITWFILDRHFFIKRMNKQVEEIDTVYKKELESVVQRANSFEDNRWSIMLLDACVKDQPWLLSKFKPGWSMVTLNSELDLAIKDYIAAFKKQEPLKPKVSRIISLLSFYAFGKSEEEAAKIDQFQKLRIKNLN